MIISESLNTNILMSSELYIYRNLKDIVFPNKLSTDDGRAFSEKICDIILKNKNYKFKKVNLWEESKENLFLLLELGIISFKLYKNKEYASVLINEDDRYVIRINEENHITLVYRGIKTTCRELYNKAQKVIEDISREFDIGYNDRFGYLNSTIDKLGTGIKAYTILHLPLLNNLNMIEGLTSELDKVGVEFHDAFTNEYKGISNLYRLSNKITVGVTAEEIFNDVEAMTYQMIVKETKERKYLKETDYEGLCDNIFRAKAILENARKMTYSEELKLISMLRFGVEVGLVKNICIADINELLLTTKYNHIKNLTDEKINENQESILRATKIRERLNSL